jgi:hypothetical protein
VTNLYVKYVVFPFYDVEGFFRDFYDEDLDRFSKFRGKTPLSGCEMNRRALLVPEIRR